MIQFATSNGTFLSMPDNDHKTAAELIDLAIKNEQRIQHPYIVRLINAIEKIKDGEPHDHN